MPGIHATPSAKQGPLTVARYLRVSTDRQSTENQEPDIARIMVARQTSGTGNVEETITYRETVSAAAKVRPEFDRMMEAARLGKFKRLYVWSLDRFGRSMFGNIRDLETLTTWGVEVISVRESWVEQTSNPMTRKLLLAIFSWIAEHERERLKERTRAGLARAVAAGKTLGRPKADIPIDVVAQACELRSRRTRGGRPFSWRWIASELAVRQLGTWNHATLAEACRKRVPSLARGNRTPPRTSRGEYS